MRRLIGLAAAVFIVVVLVIAQFVLPGIAASTLRERLAAHGHVLSVEVDAFPAIELLWHRADKVVVRMADYQVPSATLAGNLAQTTDAGTLDASVATLRSGLLTLHDATLHKQGDQLSGRAHVTEANLRAAVPILQSVTPVASAGGALVLRGTVNVLGVSVTADAVLAIRSGAIELTPNVPLGALAAVTVFSDPHVSVESIAATPTRDGFTVSGRARLG